MTYAFYATMGGFAVDIENLHNTVKQGTLTKKGLLFLADQGHFFEISADIISDKSKANLLAKVLVCLQVLWAAGQTIERNVAGYPISLLEFHTLVHVFCALVMYTLWLQKPYDVGNPVVVSSKMDDNTLAFIVASSRWRGRSGFLRKDFEKARFHILFKLLKSGSEHGKDPVFAYYGDLKQSPKVMQRNNGARVFQLDNIEDPRLKTHIALSDVVDSQTTIDLRKTYYTDWNFVRDYTVPDGVQSTLNLWSGQALCSGLGPLPYDEIKYKYPWSKGCRVQLFDKDLKRLDLAGAFISNVLLSTNASRDFSKPLPLEKSYSLFEPFNPFENHIWNRHGSRLICHREENLLFTSGIVLQIVENSGQIWEFCLLSLAAILIPAAYGGIHLSALSEMFPTPLESIFWKASCFTLLGFAVLLFLSIAASSISVLVEEWYGSFSYKYPHLSKLVWPSVKKFYKRLALAIGWILIAGCACLLLVGAPLYVGARVFLVLESFISLRHVPIGVYKTPPTNFMSYIPHL